MKSANQTIGQEPQEEAQAQVRPANGPDKNRKAYWAAYRRGLTGSPLLVFPNRAESLVAGYTAGLKERAKRFEARRLAEAEETTEALGEVIAAAGN